MRTREPFPAGPLFLLCILKYSRERSPSKFKFNLVHAQADGPLAHTAVGRLSALCTVYNARTPRAPAAFSKLFTRDAELPRERNFRSLGALEGRKNLEGPQVAMAKESLCCGPICSILNLVCWFVFIVREGLSLYLLGP